MTTNLAENITYLIKQKKTTIKELEVEAGLTRNYLNPILYKKNPNPTLAKIIKVASALGVSVGELIGEAKPQIDTTESDPIENKDIFLKTVSHLCNTLSSEKILKFNARAFLKTIMEIYNYSLKKGYFDKEFADWFINLQFDSKFSN